MGAPNQSDALGGGGRRWRGDCGCILDGRIAARTDSGGRRRRLCNRVDGSMWFLLPHEVIFARASSRHLWVIADLGDDSREGCAPGARALYSLGVDRYGCMGPLGLLALVAEAKNR